MPDFAHPSAKGYEIWAESIESEVTELMGEKEDPTLPVPLQRPREAAGWMRRHESMNARVKQGNVDLIFIGDSITHGWENEGKQVWQTFYGNRNAVNLGISRDRTQHVLWRLDHGNIEGIEPKLAVVMIGTNNSSRSKTEEIPDGIKVIVDRLRANSPKTKVLLLAIFPRGANNDDPWRQVNMKVNEAIKKFADGKTVFFVDINPLLMAADGTLSKDIMPDLLHPNAKGYRIWAEAIEPFVAKLMGEQAQHGAARAAGHALVDGPPERPERPHQAGQRRPALHRRLDHALLGEGRQGGLAEVSTASATPSTWASAATRRNCPLAARPWQHRRHFAQAGRGDDRHQQHGRQHGRGNRRRASRPSSEKLRTKLPETKILLLAHLSPRGDR